MKSYEDTLEEMNFYKYLFSSSEKVYFHYNEYKIIIEKVRLEIVPDSFSPQFKFCFYLESKDPYIWDLLEHKNGTKGKSCRISFDDKIFTCSDFIIRAKGFIPEEEYDIMTWFSIQYVDTIGGCLKAILVKSEEYDYKNDDKKKTNIKYNRFDIMDI